MIKKQVQTNCFITIKHFASKSDDYGFGFFAEKYNTPVEIKGRTTTISAEFPNRVGEVYTAIAEREKKADELHKAKVNSLVNQELLNIQNSEESTGYPQHPALYKRAVENITRGENVSMKDLERTKEGRALISGMNRDIEEYDKAKNDLFLVESLDEKVIYLQKN